MKQSATPDDSPAYAALRQVAEVKRRRTVERLLTGITRLTEQNPRPAITAKTIEQETGLTFKTIRRNAEAYELYRRHADAFQPSGPSRRRHGMSHKGRRPRTATATMIKTYDPLMAYKKAHLVARVRAALQEADDLRSALAAQTAACQAEHQRTILRLRAALTQRDVRSGWLRSELAEQ